MSVLLEAITERRPGMTLDEAIRDFARENGYHVIVTYTDRSGETKAKGIIHSAELQEVRSSPYVSNVRIAFDDGGIQSRQTPYPDSGDYAEQRLIEEFAKSQQKPNSGAKRWWQFWR